MKPTQALLRWKQALPKGHLFRGKYRLVKPVTPLNAAIKRAEFELEEKNMFYLRHPYLTIEQSRNHTEPPVQDKKLLKNQQENLDWKEHKLLGDRFGFLKVSDKWE